MKQLRPYDHVILVSLDTLRSDLVRANPYKAWPEKYGLEFSPRSEALEEVTRHGCFFLNAISAAPYTSASHASYFTGKWPLRHGVYELYNRGLQCPTIFTAAQRSGFRTISKVDFPLVLGSFLGFDRGVDSYIIEDDDKFLAELASTERSFSLVHFAGLHTPYGFHNLRYGGDDYRRTVAELESNLPQHAAAPADQLTATFLPEEDYQLLIRYNRVIEHYYGRGDFTTLFRLYLEGADYFFRHRFDPFFRRLMSVLEGKRYLVVVFGDHGEEYDERSQGHFNTVADGVLRVPVVFFGHDILPATYDRRIRTIDVAATVAQLVGLRLRWKMDGVSLADTVQSGAAYRYGPQLVKRTRVTFAGM